jgi:hypothetical protein
MGRTVVRVIDACLGLISNLRLPVPPMAVFAGAAAAALAGKLPWEDSGKLGDQMAGGLLGGPPEPYGWPSHGGGTEYSEPRWRQSFGTACPCRHRGRWDPAAEG